jgi:hypothetical protein
VELKADGPEEAFREPSAIISALFHHGAATGNKIGVTFLPEITFIGI